MRPGARGKGPAGFGPRRIPRGRRGSPVECAQYAPSSRRATRAPRCSRGRAAFHHGLLDWRRRPRLAGGSAATLGVVVLVWFAVTAGGCAGGGGPVEESATAPTIALPDLSAADVFVRDQVRAQHASLTAIVQTPTANAARRADAYGDMGKLLMAAALHDDAEPHLRRARTLAPDDARWPYYLGHLYRTTGALDDSVAAFDQVLRVRPDDALTLLWLGEVHLLAGRPEEAEPMFRAQLAMQPDSVVAHVGIGRAALATSDYARAVRFLEEGLRLSGQTAVGVHYPLALAYRGLGQLDRAEAHLRQRADVPILPEDPLMEELDTLIESPRAYERRGNRALSRRDWVTAAEYFRRGLVLEPADPTLRHRLGTVRFQMGDPGGAFAEFERILQTAPDFALAHFSLGVLLEGAGRRPAAIERFEAAVRHEPAYVEARLALAGLLRREGRFEEALTQYERVMEEAAAGDPRIEEAPFGRAVTLVRLGRHADARDRFSEGMAAYPDQPFFVHALARLLGGTTDPAVRDGARALALMEALPEAVRDLDLGESMAMALAATGRFGEAARWQRGAIDRAARGGRSDLAPRMREKLTRYERSRPWRSDDPVEFDPFLERSAGAIR